jgi:hypothetical protein
MGKRKERTKTRREKAKARRRRAKKTATMTTDALTRSGSLLVFEFYSKPKATKRRTKVV